MIFECNMGHAHNFNLGPCTVLHWGPRLHTIIPAMEKGDLISIGLLNYEDPHCDFQGAWPVPLFGCCTDHGTSLGIAEVWNWPAVI